YNFKKPGSSKYDRTFSNNKSVELLEPKTIEKVKYKPMMKFSKDYVPLFFICLTILIGCKTKDPAPGDEATTETRTPVTVTSMSYDPIEEFVELNATSTFLQKSYVKSNLTGYIKKVNIKLGDFVNPAQVLFVVKTKEAEAIGNSVNRLNPEFKFSGVNSIPASDRGYIAELNHQAGDYVQDGEQLAVISNSKSFMFVMNVPYEDKPYVITGKQVEVTLPDGERLLGTVQASMPSMDSASQTQAVAVRVNPSHTIPQNLVAKVKIVKVSKAAAATLPKQAVLSDETLSEFWVMKMINDTTAVKVSVKTGIETGDKIEIVSPDFSPKDRMLLRGNYGLPDTALVIMQK
ncbi:MAG: efflux RND transporter periplasmic adaptor subunit, partial [Ginsengibacter sp.]